MANITGFFVLRDQEFDTGLSRFTGTDFNQFSSPDMVLAPSGKCYVSGSIINTSPRPCKLRIISGNQVIAEAFLAEYGILKMTRQPFTAIKIAVNGTVALRAVGFVTDFEDKKEEAMFLARSGIEIIDRNYKDVWHNFDQTIDTDITGAATTNVIDGITDDRNLAVGKIFISTDGVTNVEVQYERGGSIQYIGQVQFAAAGFAIIDDVPPCTLGSDIAATPVRLQAITSAAVIVVNISGHFAEE